MKHAHQFHLFLQPISAREYVPRLVSMLINDKHGQISKRKNKDLFRLLRAGSPSIVTLSTAVLLRIKSVSTWTPREVCIARGNDKMDSACNDLPLVRRNNRQCELRRSTKNDVNWKISGATKHVPSFNYVFEILKNECILSKQWTFNCITTCNVM